KMKKLIPIILMFLVLAACKHTEVPIQIGKDWPMYGGNPLGNRYSRLNQINAANVKNLKVVWMYNAAEVVDTTNHKHQTAKAIQRQPIVIRGVLYGTTPEL